jgi:hypothetical protein
MSETEITTVPEMRAAVSEMLRSATKEVRFILGDENCDCLLCLALGPDPWAGSPLRAAYQED